jgi:hypothetical protein
MESEPLDRTARRYAPVALAVVLVAVVAFVTATSGLHVRELARAPRTPRAMPQTLPAQPTATPLAGPTATPGPVPAVVTSLLPVLVVLACLGAIALLVMLAVRIVRHSARLRRDRFPAGEAMPATPGRSGPTVLDAAVTAGLVELADDSDPRGAVINAWVRLERAAEQLGAIRAPADTPADLATRLLSEHAVPADVLARLAGLYRAARYSPHPVDDAMRVEALEAFGAVQDALRQPVPSG